MHSYLEACVLKCQPFQLFLLVLLYSSYSNFCDILTPFLDKNGMAHCPPILQQNNFPCTCPLQPGHYHINPVTFKILPLEADYNQLAEVSNILWIDMLCLGYICHGRRTIYLSTIFRTTFCIVGGYKLRRMRLHCLRLPCDFFRRQTRRKPYRDLADIVRHRAGIMLPSRPPHINRTMPVWWPCDCGVIMCIRVL